MESNGFDDSLMNNIAIPSLWSFPHCEIIWYSWKHVGTEGLHDASSIHGDSFLTAPVQGPCDE